MALDFPASPTVGQKYPSPAVTGVPVYSWDGEKWTTLGGAIGSTGASDAIPAEVAGTGAAGSSTLWSRGDHAHPATAPTPPIGDNDTSIATTAFVTAAVVNSTGSIPTTYVRYDQPQTLTAPQLIQARQNIYAAPFDAMAYSGLQINGGMEVSQERGTSATGSSGSYVCDGWKLYLGGTMAVASAVGAGSGVTGIPYFLAMTVITAQSSLAAADYAMHGQFIEGWRMARLGWGTAAAQPITISFWSCHHRGGVYGGSVRNAGNTRTYAFTYTQQVDTWQYNTITIPGDTTGTWAVDNTAGMFLVFSNGAGSTYIAPSANAWIAGSYHTGPGQVNAVAATSDVFRITGVIVIPGNEAPSAARSPFVMRSYQDELLICRRYFYNGVPPLIGVASSASTIGRASCRHPVSMRAAPTLTVTSALTFFDGTGVMTVSAVGINYSSVDAIQFDVTSMAGPTATYRPVIVLPPSGGNLNVDARL